jgi:hypothetical protein
MTAQWLDAVWQWGSSEALSAVLSFGFIVVAGGGHVVEGAGGGQRAALSTGRAGARQRIVHMSTAFPAPGHSAHS